MTSTDIQSAFGFTWTRGICPDAPIHSVHRAVFRFKSALPEFVWDASVLEGNPFTFPEVKTLLDGVTVGGHKLSDEAQVLNLAASARLLAERVQDRTFRLDKPMFCELHGRVAAEEALEWGHFRGEGDETGFTPHVALGNHPPYKPSETEPGATTLNRTFSEGVAALYDAVPNPLERGLAFYLFGALQQFFFDGNKRTARAMMNGELMRHGIDAISVPAARAQEFNEKMVRFYVSRHGDEMHSFLLDCHPDKLQPQIDWTNLDSGTQAVPRSGNDMAP